MGDVAVLLGAGASRDAGLPTTVEMTERLSDAVQPDTRGILFFVAAQLLASESVRGHSPFAGLDVERVMTAIELLGQRNDLEISPFVYAWHPGVEQFAADPRSSVALLNLARELRKGIASPSDYDLTQTLEKLVSINSRTWQLNSSAYRTAFARLQAALINVLRAPADTQYLRDLFELAKHEWLAIATLNYDRTIEIEAGRAGVPITTGIDSWARSGDWAWGDEGVRLVKLHGSIDWQAIDRDDSTLPQYRVEAVADPAHVRTPAVIFGGRYKLGPQGPFLELLTQFESMLRQANLLLIVGYSFRDDHVNEVVRRWLNTSVDTRIVVVDPFWPEQVGWDSFLGQLSRGLRYRKAVAVGDHGGWRTAGAPERLQRIRILRMTARSGLPEAIRIATSNERPWQPETYS